MSLTFLFWFFMLLWFILSFVWGVRTPRENIWGFAPLGANFFVFVLIALLGVRVFGWPISSGG